MNNSVLIKKFKSIYVSICKNNFGLSKHIVFSILGRNKNYSHIGYNKGVLNIINNYIENNFECFNRIFKINNRNRILNLKKQSSWKGIRIRQGLPLNGQRTHSNAKTAKREKN